MAWLHAVRLITIAAVRASNAARGIVDFSVRCRNFIVLLQLSCRPANIAATT
jgi:hypothetical protein